MKCERPMSVLLTLRSIFPVSSILLNSRTKLEKHKICRLILAILASHFASALQDGANTVFVRENGTVALKWSLFIGENAGRSSVNVMIKNRDALLCQWVKAHGEVNSCNPGMKLTISPEHVRVPGPTNITATFSFKNKGRVDDGTYECRFVIDQKWYEIQVYPRQLVTTGTRGGKTTQKADVHGSKNTPRSLQSSHSGPSRTCWKVGPELQKTIIQCQTEVIGT